MEKVAADGGGLEEKGSERRGQTGQLKEESRRREIGTGGEIKRSDWRESWSYAAWCWGEEEEEEEGKEEEQQERAGGRGKETNSTKIGEGELVRSKETLEGVERDGRTCLAASFCLVPPSFPLENQSPRSQKSKENECFPRRATASHSRHVHSSSKLTDAFRDIGISVGGGVKVGRRNIHGARCE